MNPQTIKALGVGVGAAVAGFLVGTFLLTIPMPTVKEIKQDGPRVTLTVSTRDNEVILVFPEGGQYPAMAVASPKKDTIDIEVLVATGTRELIIRAVDGGWRSSAPKRVTLPSGTSVTPSTATSTSDTDELPPPGIPPTSTGTTRSSPTSTAAKPAESISAAVSVSSLNPKLKATQTVTVSVKDNFGRPVIGATVTAIARYSTGDVTYTLRGSNGSYSMSFKLPNGLGAGSPVILDVTAAYQGLTSTARASFTPR